MRKDGTVVGTRFDSSPSERVLFNQPQPEFQRDPQKGTCTGRCEVNVGTWGCRLQHRNMLQECVLTYGMSPSPYAALLLSSPYGRTRVHLRVHCHPSSFQNDVYWQSAAAETFQGILLSRIRCRACGRHSDQPDRFYDLSVPLLAAAGPPPGRAAASPATVPGGAGGAGSHVSSRVDSFYNNRLSRDIGSNTIIGNASGMSPIVTEQPISAVVEGHSWEPRSESISESRTGDGGSGVVDGAESEAERGAEWSWRRQRGGWCLASDGRGPRGAGGRLAMGEGGWAAVRQGGSSQGSGYGWVSSFGVWLGVKSVALEVRSVRICLALIPVVWVLGCARGFVGEAGSTQFGMESISPPCRACLTCALQRACGTLCTRTMFVVVFCLIRN